MGAPKLRLHGANHLHVRLSNANASSIVYWDNVLLRAQSERFIHLPSWIDHEDQVRRLLTYNPSTRYDQEEHQEWPMERITPEMSDPNNFRLAHVPRSGPLIVEAMRTYSTLSTDTATTACPENLLLPKVLAELYDLLASSTGIDVLDLERIRAKAAAEYGGQVSQHVPQRSRTLGFRDGWGWTR